MSSFSVPLELCTPGDWAGTTSTHTSVFTGDLRNIMIWCNSIIYACVCFFDSHGQLGHGVLTSEEDPRAVEALWGMSMSCVATGGWHSVCISGICYTKDDDSDKDYTLTLRKKTTSKTFSSQMAVTFMCGAGMKAASLDFHHED